MRYIIVNMAITLFFFSCSSLGPKKAEHNNHLSITKKKSDRVYMDFELINNLVVIPLRINNSDTLNFILDTGLRNTLISNLPSDTSFTLNYSKEVVVEGLGNNQPLPALLSKKNKIYMKGIRGDNEQVIVLMEDRFQFSSMMGKKIHGIIGAQVFKNFIVKIDYEKKRLTFYDPDLYATEYQKLKKSRKWENVPITLHDSRPYLEAKICQISGTDMNVKLLIDSGASHPVALYTAASSEIVVPQPSIYSFLGNGLEGELYGEIGKVPSMYLGGFQIDYPVAFYPEEESIKKVLRIEGRHGAIGSELLKKFTIYFNYQDQSILLRKNGFFNKPTRYNMSGISLYAPIHDLRYYEISHIREHSPAYKAGLRAGDEVLEVNQQKVHIYTIGELLEYIHSRENNTIEFLIKREGKVKKIQMKLVDQLVVTH